MLRNTHVPQKVTVETTTKEIISNPDDGSLRPKRVALIDGQRVEVDEFGRPKNQVSAISKQQTITATPLTTDPWNKLIPTGHPAKVTENITVHTETITTSNNPITRGPLAINTTQKLDTFTTGNLPMPAPPRFPEKRTYTGFPTDTVEARIIDERPTVVAEVENLDDSFLLELNRPSFPLNNSGMAIPLITAPRTVTRIQANPPAVVTVPVVQTTQTLPIVQTVPVVHQMPIQTITQPPVVVTNGPIPIVSAQGGVPYNFANMPALDKVNYYAHQYGIDLQDGGSIVVLGCLFTAIILILTHWIYKW